MAKILWIMWTQFTTSTNNALMRLKKLSDEYSLRWLYSGTESYRIYRKVW